MDRGPRHVQALHVLTAAARASTMGTKILSQISTRHALVWWRKLSYLSMCSWNEMDCRADLNKFGDPMSGTISRSIRQTRCSPAWIHCRAATTSNESTHAGVPNARNSVMSQPLALPQKGFYNHHACTPAANAYSRLGCLPIARYNWQNPEVSHPEATVVRTTHKEMIAYHQGPSRPLLHYSFVQQN